MSFEREISRFEACARREGLRLEFSNPAITVYFSRLGCKDEKLAVITYGCPIIPMELPRKNRTMLLFRLLAFADLLGGYSVVVPPGILE